MQSVKFKSQISIAFLMAVVISLIASVNKPMRARSLSGGERFSERSAQMIDGSGKHNPWPGESLHEVACYWKEL